MRTGLNWCLLGVFRKELIFSGNGLQRMKCWFDGAKNWKKDKEIKKESFSGPASYPISSCVSGGEAGSCWVSGGEQAVRFSPWTSHCPPFRTHSSVPHNLTKDTIFKSYSPNFLLRLDWDSVSVILINNSNQLYKEVFLSIHRQSRSLWGRVHSFNR